jgi:hypothetical protein
MVEGKNWWASRGVVGGLVALVCGVLAAMGYAATAEDAAIMTNATEAVLSAISAVGGAVALWGRIRATKRIRR